MPATYAHYRFGASMLKSMPADLRRTAKRNRRLFDVGLHGPDLFFYYRPMRTTRVGQLGGKLHRQTGKEFFSRVCRSLRLEPSEAGQAYLYGVLCHYALDSRCHPLVEAAERDGAATHTRIETEFDRFLLELDGKPADTGLTAHLTLTAQECAEAARFYPGVEARHIRDSLKGMVSIRRVLEMQESPLRTVLTKAVSAGSETFRDMLPRQLPDPVSRKLNAQLLARYEQAAEAFPEMLLKLSAHLTYNAPLGEEFSPNFG